MTANKVATLPTAQAHVPAVAHDQSPLLAPAVFDAAWRLAEAMSRAKTLPEHLRGSPADCLRVVEFAYRCGQSPFALADKTYFVQGKLAMEGQAIAALVNSQLEDELDYLYEGEGRERAVRVVGKRAKWPHPREVRVTVVEGLADSKGARQRWERAPDQMLAYYGARVWARRHMPGAILGIYSPDELRAAAEGGTEMIDVTPRADSESAASGGAEPGQQSEPAKPVNGNGNGHKTKTINVYNDQDAEIGQFASLGEYLDGFAKWWAASRTTMTSHMNADVLRQIVRRMPDDHERRGEVEKLLADLEEDLAARDQGGLDV